MLNIDWLNQVVLLLAKWWILSAVTLLLVARSRNTSASTLHAILLFALLAMCLMPLLQRWLPGFNVSVISAAFATSTAYSWVLRICILLYGLVAVALTVKYLRQLREIHCIYRASKRLAIAEHKELMQQLQQKWGMPREIELVYSDQIDTPLTFGFRTPKILLPNESLFWSIDRVRRFLLHELAHIRRGDWLAKILSRTVVNIFWLVPTAWTLLGKIEWFAELACDDAVINAEGSRADYADDLLEMTANGRAFAGAVALIETHGHYDRIAAVLDGGRIRSSDRLKFWPYAAVFAGILLLLSGVRLAPVMNVSPENYEFIPLEMFADAVAPAVDSVAVPMTPVGLREDLIVSSAPIVVPRPAFVPPKVVKTEPAAFAREFVLPGDFTPMAASVELLKPLVIKTPAYPKKALKKQLEGRVVVAFDVLPDGSVADVTIVAAEPQKLFDKSVVAAVKQFRYPPQTGTVANVMEVFEFKLLEDAQSLPAAQR